MAYAILLTPEDLTEIEDGLSDTTGMSATDRNRANLILSRGVNAWRNANLIPPEHPCYTTDGDTMRVVVVNGGTLEQARGWIRTMVARYPQCAGLAFYESFLASPVYGIDPWPPAVPLGQFWAGLTCT